MDSQQKFVKFVLGLSGVVMAFFFLEFFLEWLALGRPGMEDLSWAPSNNGKLADILSPMARAYNNILGMLVATIALAIPLTANMYTAKLIDMFLRDRVNQFMLFFWAIGAAHVLWVLYLIGPKFAPLWAVRLAVAGALLGWIVLIPYFFYIVRFLDPSNILARLEEDVTRMIDAVEKQEQGAAGGQTLFLQRLHEIGTIVLKTIDRGERGVTLEGIQALKDIIEHYGQRKAKMPAAWFVLQRSQFIGFSDDAVALLQEDKTWVEHRVGWHIFLAYQAALAKTQDVISSLSEASRDIALLAEARGDDKALELSIKFFNNYLREAIKRKDVHAIYDLFYQYRLLADSLWDRPEFLKKIGQYFRIYGAQAEAAGLPFIVQIMGIDLGAIIRKAYEHKSAAAADLLQDMLSLKHKATDPQQLLIKAKAILGGYFVESGMAAEAAKLRENLADLPEATLAAVERELLTLQERSFWEVTDRQVTFDWVPPEQRPAIKQFLDSVRQKAAA